jgi:uncharacterized small protein (DUF1192 family)
VLNEDDRPKRPVGHEIGADLSAISADELRERVALLRAEIARLEEEVGRKEASKAAANAFFRAGA